MLLSVVALHPVGEDVFATFSVHPSTVIGILALGALYWWRTRAEDRVPTRGQIVSFIAGLVVLFFTLNGPLHDLSDDYLFSAHMVQHLVLTMAVPPLLIAGIPGWMIRPALRIPGVFPVARRIGSGLGAFLVFSVAMMGWHVPQAYNLAMTHHPIHIVEHLCFLVAATIMWWPLMSSLPEVPRLPYPGQLLYTFLLMIPMMIISIFITYSDTVLYPFYAHAPRIWEITALQDQRIGGLIMWIPGGFVFIGILSVIFFKWAARGMDDAASAQVDWKPVEADVETPASATSPHWAETPATPR
ncbi:MAG TPA: cytochrome c oxidase assembly protein [Gemmatimonadaceae bacterium]|nr:cytochrome c oxidase assembly protein [Gemmatimonadaceae bacterium]